MKTKLRQLLRPVYAAPALALIAVSVLPIFMQTADAAAPYQVVTRSIKMSNSQTSAGSVTYDVTFSESSSSYPATIKGIVVDFCSTDPIPGDTCTAPAAPFAVTSTFTNDGDSVTNNASISGWTGGILNSGRTFDATSATGVATSSTAYVFNFQLTGVTNTATLGSFYARIFTYTTTAGATGYTDTNPNAGGGEQDYGGIALSTANVVDVTAKVQEQLTFCVYTATTCATQSGTPAVSLGNSGILSSTAYWVDNSTKYDIQTNAQTGATVTASAPTTLTGPGGATINALTTAATGTSIVGASEWGMCTYAGTAGGGTSGTFTPNTNYNGGTTACNATNVTAGSGTTSGVKYYFNGIGSTYGDPIATQGAGSGYTGNVVPIIASTSAAQAAGIYTMTLDFIATGTF